MKIARLKSLGTVLLAASVLHLSACGYFLYPERRGQEDGKIDTAVALLDAAGLLIGIIPGVIAFVVDITTGAIYLPANDKTLIDKHLDVLRDAPESSALTPTGQLDRTAIARQLETTLNRPVAAEAIQFYTVDPRHTETLAAIVFEQVN